MAPQPSGSLTDRRATSRLPTYISATLCEVSQMDMSLKANWAWRFLSIGNPRIHQLYRWNELYKLHLHCFRQILRRFYNKLFTPRCLTCKPFNSPMVRVGIWGSPDSKIFFYAEQERSAIKKTACANGGLVPSQCSANSQGTCVLRQKGKIKHLHMQCISLIIIYESAACLLGAAINAG